MELDFCEAADVMGEISGFALGRGERHPQQPRHRQSGPQGQAVCVQAAQMLNIFFENQEEYP